jgi:hypothetical protein
MSFATKDEWLRSLEPKVRRRLRREAAEAEADPFPPPPRIPDADQGVRGPAPGRDEPKLSKDGFLMMVRDEGRRGEGGVAPEEWYAEAYAE